MPTKSTLLQGVDTQKNNPTAVRGAGLNSESHMDTCTRCEIDAKNRIDCTIGNQKNHLDVKFVERVAVNIAGEQVTAFVHEKNVQREVKRWQNDKLNSMHVMALFLGNGLNELL